MGVLAALAGWAWSAWLPWNKQLWTPSFVLWTGGLAALALAYLSCQLVSVVAGQSTGTYLHYFGLFLEGRDVLFATVNIGGGFLVTQRMLKMFRKRGGGHK